ncbi:hydrogenase [Novosphingobium sp. B 225]|uniref:hydrogenase n=1 Tax=Novosphingobium sp. B 225 TaxID=1961849 RepID=UPI000B4B9AD2|nr:hydrogenase [Novosphingobium sp. B 225]
MSVPALVLGKAGVILFTAGLAVGAAIPSLRNPRMGLSAHLTAVQGGLALMVFDLYWDRLGIAPWASTPLAWSLALSTYLLVAGLVLAAVTGASRALPIAGHGFNGTPSAELTVSILTIGASIWMLLVCLAVCGFLLAA